MDTKDADTRELAGVGSGGRGSSMGAPVDSKAKGLEARVRRRQRRLEEGRCAECYSRWPEDGKKTCELCLLLRRQRRRRALAKGLCGLCRKRPRTEGLTTCDGCRSRERETRSRYQGKPEKRRIRRAAGVCTTCGGDRDIPNGIQCSACRERAYARRLAVYEGGFSYWQRDAKSPPRPFRCHWCRRNLDRGPGDGLIDRVDAAWVLIRGATRTEARRLARGMFWECGYRCRDCGKEGWTRHPDVEALHVERFGEFAEDDDDRRPR